MTTKYYLKEKCKILNEFPSWHTKPESFYGCDVCKNQGFTRGADITELIEFMLKMGAEHIVQALITNNLIEVVEE